MPRPPPLLLPIADHVFLTLKSLTTALLLSTFHLLSRLIHAAASRLLHATNPRSAPAPPPALRLPHDNASTLNYLYTPTSTSSRTPLPPQAAYATPPPRHPNPSPSLVIPPRVSLTESIQVWLWLTVDIAFDIPRYLLGTTSSFNFNGISDDERPETTTSSVVRDAGYPLEEHAVTTSDGYRLTMQRLPRKDASKIVFFMHGVLDTSLGWVCNGTCRTPSFFVRRTPPYPPLSPDLNVSLPISRLDHTSQGPTDRTPSPPTTRAPTSGWVRVLPAPHTTPDNEFSRTHARTHACTRRSHRQATAAPTRASGISESRATGNTVPSAIGRTASTSWG